jgi:hypothetical protein
MPPLCRRGSAAAAKPLRRSSAAVEAGLAKVHRPLRKTGSIDRLELSEMLADLPRHGDWGTRFEERGRKQWWKGYQLHDDLSHSGLPLSYVRTSAWLHDSPAAIPLAQARPAEGRPE